MTRPIDTLSDAIDAYENLAVHQNRVQMQHGDVFSVMKIDWTVPGQMALAGQSTDLDAGTYYLKIPVKEADANTQGLRNFCLPKGAVLKKVTVQTHVAKVGSGTITPYLGTSALTAISSVGVVNDDTAAGCNAAPVELTSDTVFKVVVASDVVTAGAFTIYIEFYQGPRV